MAEVKIIDQVIKSADRATFYDLVDNSIMATVNQITNFTLAQTQNTIYYTGKLGVRLTSLDTEKNVEATIANGLIDIGVLAAQVGKEVEIYDGITKFIESPYIDEIVTSDGLTAKTSYPAYNAVTGAEIEYIYKLHGSGISGAERLTQAATADANNMEFAYDPATLEITLPTGVFIPGEVFLAQYKYKAFGTSISSDTDHFSKSAKAVVDLTVMSVCDDSLSHAQIILPKAKVDGNFELTVGDNAAVHNITLASMPSVCFGASKKLFDYMLVNPVI